MSERPLIVIPAFNEAKNLPAVIPAIRRACPADLLVVDDGSKDETAAVARRLGAWVVSHPFNLGYATALQTGFRFAIGKGYSCVVQMDADGQHEPADIPRLLQTLKEQQVDMVIGSRFLGERTYRPTVARRAGMALFGAAVRFHTGKRLTDCTSGFRALAPRALVFLSGDSYPVDYPDADVLIMLHREGFRVSEIPVRMYAKPGKQSMHGGLMPIYYVFKMTLSILVTLLRARGR